MAPGTPSSNERTKAILKRFSMSFDGCPVCSATSHFRQVNAGDEDEGVISFPQPMTDDLIKLLRLRVSVISDHGWRDRDSEGHLGALKDVSEKLSAWIKAHRSEVDPQLRHYLANSSFQKALDHLESP